MIRIESNIAPEEEILKPTIFPDGTKLLKFDPRRDEYTITWLYDSDDELCQLIALTKHLKNKGCKVWLNMPYVPNARMDRVKNREEVFTLKAFADTINWLGFEEVRITNPHSTVSEALFDRVYVDFNCVYGDVKHILETSLNPINILYYPDSGAQKRYNDILATFGLPSAYGIKNRDWKTGQILGLNVVTPIDLTGKNILIIDDICSRGTTFVKSAEKLKELGADKIALYVTHCEDTIHDGEVLKNNGLIDIVYTTNSIYRGVASHKLKVIREF